MITRLYLDDRRSLPANYDILISDYTSCINMINLLTSNQIPFMLSFDHDIGDENLSGYTIAKYIVENHIPMVSFAIHSANAVGAHNIRELLTHYGYREVF